MPDHSSKTEQATPKRLEKAREEGQFPAARELVSALQFMVFLGLLGAGGAHWFGEFRAVTRRLFSYAFRPELTPQDLTFTIRQLFGEVFLPLVIGGMAIAVATLLIRLITTRFGLSVKKLAPDFKRLDPLAKLRELPRQNLPALMQAVVLLPLFLWAVYVVARDHIDAFLTLPLVSVESGSALVGASMMTLCWKAAGVFLVFGAIDLYRQMQRHKHDMMMSKQDIRDEIKEVEGNPHMKQRVRRLQRDRARRNMMKAIPTATAVVVNPTHFAVAIRYQLESMTAPVVVAKGKNYLALRIRQKAIENQVPIIENPPLAQALYQSVDVGQEVPAHLYRAVAEVLAYIFKLMNGRLPG